MIIFIYEEFQTPHILPTGEVVFSDALSSLPDADLRAEAEILAKKGDYISALNILDYIIEADLPDKIAAEQLKNEYLVIIERKNSLWGKSFSTIKGLLWAKPDDIYSLVGSMAGDLVVYGDIRDLAREIMFEDDPDEFIILFSSIGIAATATPLDIGASLIKTAKKIAVLSKPLVNQILVILQGIKNTTAPLAKLEEASLPFYYLWQNSKKSFNTFLPMLRASTDVKQIKLLAQIAEKGTNAKKLSEVLTIAPTLGTQFNKQFFDFLTQYGQKGVDILYASMRKGRQGAELLIKHPWLKTSATRKVLFGSEKIGKLTLKGTPIAIRVFIDKIRDFTRDFPSTFMLIKYVFMAILSIILLLLLGMRPILKSVFTFSKKQNFSQGTIDESATRKKLPHKKSKSALAFFYLVLLSTIALMFMVFDFAYDSYQNNTSNFTTTQGTTQEAGGFAMPSPLVLAMFIIMLVAVYAWCYSLAKKHLESICAEQQSASMKLRLIENLDIYFDLPLYVGLGVTILAFIVITLGGIDSARTMAYSATLLGIVCAVWMRLFLLKPQKEFLIKEQAMLENSL